jgi:hypothetical protein
LGNQGRRNDISRRFFQFVVKFRKTPLANTPRFYEFYPNNPHILMDGQRNNVARVTNQRILCRHRVGKNPPPHQTLIRTLLQDYSDNLLIQSAS